MSRTCVVAIALALVAVGCADDPDTPGANADDAASPRVTTPESPSDAGTAGLSTEDPAVQDAILLTAVDEVLADTRFADLVDQDPGVFLETAATLCTRLDGGDDSTTVLSAYLSSLEAEGLELDEDTAYLGGALLGAAVTVRCPEHEDAIAEVGP